MWEKRKDESSSAVWLIMKSDRDRVINQVSMVGGAATVDDLSGLGETAWGRAASSPQNLGVSREQRQKVC